MLLLSVNQRGQRDAAAFSAAYGGVCDGAWCSKRATGRCAALASLNGTQRTQHNALHTCATWRRPARHVASQWRIYACSCCLLTQHIP